MGRFLRPEIPDRRVAPSGMTRLEYHANLLHLRAAARSGDAIVGEDSAHLCALWILHRDLPDLSAARRRARFAAGKNLPDEGDARVREAGDARDRQAHRPL